MATLAGLEAVEALLDDGAAEDSVLIGTQGDAIVRSPLMACVARTKDVGAALAAHAWERAFELRGPQFAHAWATYKVVARAFPHEHPDSTPQVWGVLHVGAPAPGMNAAVRAVVRLGLDRGHKVYGIYNGFAGLAEMEAGRMAWQSVAGWSNLGGALLGSNRDQPDQVPGGLAAVAAALERLHVDALVIVGGWEAYTAAALLAAPEVRARYPALNVTVVLVPATISNNCPGYAPAPPHSAALTRAQHAPQHRLRHRDQHHRRHERPPQAERDGVAAPRVRVRDNVRACSRGCVRR